MARQELMSGEAAKECVTTAYTWVPSKSKSLASELPNMETTRSIKRQSDAHATYAFRDSDLRKVFRGYRAARR